MENVQITGINGNQYRTADGRILTAIGNKNINVGEYVWTDGKVIFGNEQTGGSSTITSTLKGIPVIDFNSGMIGYIDTKKLTTKDLAKNEKIKRLVNDANYIYAITNSAISDLKANKKINIKEDLTKIVDAEIDSEGNIYLLFDGKYRYDATSVKMKFPAFEYSAGIIFKGKTYEENIYDCEVGSGKDAIVTGTPIKIYKNETMVKKIEIGDYVPDISNELNKTIATLGFKKQEEVDGVIYPPRRLPPDEQTLNIDYKMLSGKIDKNGQYKILFQVICNKMVFPWIAHNCYKSFTGNIKAKSYLINICRATMIFELNNDGVKIIDKNLTSEFKFSSITCEFEQITIEQIDKLGIIDGIGNSKFATWHSWGYSKYVNGIFQEAYRIKDLVPSPYYYAGELGTVDKNSISATKYIENGGNPIAKTIEKENNPYKVLLNQDGAYLLYHYNQHKFDIYTAQNTKIASNMEDSTLEFIRYNACLYKISDNTYLFSIRNGNLYKIQKGKVEKITQSGNFRICQQNNLKKLKRKITAVE